jgi:hypothetical protein
MGYQETIFEQAAALGGEVNRALEPARVFLRRADELNKQLDAARKAEEAEYAKLVESAASTGELPTLNGWGRWVFDSPSSKLVVASVALCHTKASAAAREAGPRIFAALQRRVAGIVAESVKQSVALPRGVDSEAKALRARDDDRKALDTWERLRELVDEWTGCHELARTMQRATWIAGPEHPRDRDGARLFERYQAPLSLPPGYWNRTPAELRLGVALASGASPGLYPWPDAVARFERHDRRQRNYISTQVLTRHDGLGNIVSEERSPETPSEFMPSRR